MCAHTIEARFTSRIQEISNDKAFIEKAIIGIVSRTQPFSKIEFLMYHYDEIDNRFDSIDYDEKTNTVYLTKSGVFMLAKILGTSFSTISKLYFEEVGTVVSTSPKNPWICYAMEVSDQTMEFIKYLFE